MKFEQGVELSRFTTLGAGGPAKAFARPESVDELEEALGLGARGGAARGHHRARLEPARRRRGVRRARAQAGRRAGRGARRRRAAARGRRRRQRRLSPPRARGRSRRLRVRVRDPGHDRRRCLDERRRLRQRLGRDPRPGARRRRRRGRAGSRRRSSASATGTRSCATARSSRAPSSRLAPLPEEQIKANVARLQALRKAAQPTNKRTFGSVFKNPEHELSAGRMLEACGLKGHRIGGAQISPRHANFIENADGARAADAVALMAEARRRALGAVRGRARARGRVPRAARAAAAAVGAAVRRGETRHVPQRASQRPRTRAAVVQLPVLERAPLSSLPPVGPLAARRLRDRARRGRPLPARALHADVRRADDRGRRRSTCGRCPRARGARADRGPEPAGAERGRGRAAPGEAPRRGGRRLRPELPAHPAGDRSARAPGRGRSPRAEGLAGVGEHAHDRGGPARHAPRASAHLARTLRRAPGGASP